MKSASHPLTSPTLDRYHLHNVRSAYLKLNQARLELAQQTLAESQHIFLDVLPALLHFNHPMLPGYISRNTPTGLYEFALEEKALQQLQKFSRSFQTNKAQYKQADILALFSMGSLGTIAQSSKSDIDIWLCHRTNLNENALRLLEKKCDRICAWAKTLQLDVTIFLMNHQSFRLTQKLNFNKEASGSTQHYSLLDEFYRTAIHLGGQLPAWIFIHPEQEKHYSQYLKTLCQQQLIPDKALINFGEIQHIPASEFISSAIWQLYKAIDSPYKSIMKLLVLEIYCQNLSQPDLLSNLFKKQLHAVDKRRIIHLWDADPYLQTYYFIENYLISTDQKKRLEFLRRCFYFKLEQPLTGDHKISPKSAIVLEMTKYWGWEKSHIKHLDNHNYWSLQDILEERRLIINELNNSYHLIMQFFRSRKIRIDASNRELNILGRKLHAAFSKKAGKVEWVNPLLSKKIAEPAITIKRHKKIKLWIAYNTANKKIVSKTTLIELITWLHCNQVMIPSSRIRLDDKTLDLRIIQSLRRFVSSILTTPIKSATHEEFEKGCHLKKLLFFIDYNYNQNIDNKETKLPLKITQMRCQIDTLSINNWNEIICDSKQGALLETVVSIFIESIKKESSDFNPDVLCSHPNRTIQKQLRQTVDQLLYNINTFFKKNPNGRYISYIYDVYLYIHINEQYTDIQWLSTEKALKNVLSTTMPYRSHVGMDANTMAYHPLSIFTRTVQADAIQVFYQPRGHEADITLIDEFGTWNECTIDYTKGRASLQAFHRFLRAVSERRLDQPKADISPLDILPITFHELIHTNSGWVAHIHPINSLINNANISITAVAEYIDKEYQFTLLCFNDNTEEEIFSEVNEGRVAYKKLRQFIHQQQKANSRTTYYITDIDLSRCRAYLSNAEELHTSHYLSVKLILEQKINRALSHSYE